MNSGVIELNATRTRRTLTACEPPPLSHPFNHDCSVTIRIWNGSLRECGASGSLSRSFEPRDFRRDHRRRDDRYFPHRPLDRRARGTRPGCRRDCPRARRRPADRRGLAAIRRLAVRPSGRRPLHRTRRLRANQNGRPLRPGPARRFPALAARANRRPRRWWYTRPARGSSDVAIPGLTPARAEELQESLRRLAIESAGEDAV